LHLSEHENDREQWANGVTEPTHLKSRLNDFVVNFPPKVTALVGKCDVVDAPKAHEGWNGKNKSAFGFENTKDFPQGLTVIVQMLKDI